MDELRHAGVKRGWGTWEAHMISGVFLSVGLPLVPFSFGVCLPYMGLLR